MKKFIGFFILLIGFQYMGAQSFQETEKYNVIKEIKENGQDYPACVINLVRSGGISENLTSLTINDTELFEDIFVTSLENPGLEGISEVIKIEVEYLSCCANVDSYYYLLTDEDKLIALPKLENVYCEDSNADNQYTFPVQEFGINNNILKTETTYTERSQIDNVSLKKSFIWNDDRNANLSEITALTGF